MTTKRMNYLETGMGKRMDGGFFQRAAESSLVVPAGYVSTGVVGTAPMWIQDLSGYLEFGAVVFAVLVGATTLYINVLNIIEKHKKRQRVKKRAGIGKLS